MRSATGDDFGVGDSMGLAETGLFGIYNTGPTGETFNFADSGSKVHDLSFLFWLAHNYNRPLYAWYQREHYLNRLFETLGQKKRLLPLLERNPRPYPLNLLWYSSSGDEEELNRLPLNRLFRGEAIEIAYLRDGWGRMDTFLGIKGGKN